MMSGASLKNLCLFLQVMRGQMMIRRSEVETVLTTIENNYNYICAVSDSKSDDEAEVNFF